MKKRIYLALIISVLLVSFTSCKKDNDNCEPIAKGCYKGRLELQGICLNYTIKVLEGSIDQSLIQGSWQDPVTGKTYENVFRLEDPCDFPPTLKEGDEFYFQIKANPNKNCGICEAYRPTPAKGLSIQVLSGPCNNTSN